MNSILIIDDSEAALKKIGSPPPARAAGWIRKITNVDDFVASLEKFLRQTGAGIET